MKFHLFIAVLFALLSGVLYFLFAGVQEEFKEARPQIQKEAVRSVQQHRQKSLSQMTSETTEEKHRALNPQIYVKPTTSPADSKVAANSSAEASGIMIERIGNDEFWCREGGQARKEKNPVRCYYSSTCYGCTGSTVIPPDSEGVIPFCDNGSQAEIFSIECCPDSVSGSEMECPSPRACLHAEAVPESFCTCNNRPDCKYVDIAGNLECVCIQ